MDEEKRAVEVKEKEKEKERSGHQTTKTGHKWSCDLPTVSLRAFFLLLHMGLYRDRLLAAS